MGENQTMPASFLLSYVVHVYIRGSRSRVESARTQLARRSNRMHGRHRSGVHRDAPWIGSKGIPSAVTGLIYLPLPETAVSFSIDPDTTVYLELSQRSFGICFARVNLPSKAIPPMRYRSE